MGNDHFFSDLKSAGRKLYKFQQRKLPYTGHGNCLPLALMFIKEQLAGNFAHRDGRPRGLQQFMPRPGTYQNEHNANIPTIESAAYLEGGFGSDNDIDYAERAIGLQQLAHYRMPELSSHQNRDGNDNYLDMIVRAVDYLPANHGLLVIVVLTTYRSVISHSWSFVRSYSDSITFFDPNIGVYSVTDIVSFMGHLRTGYERFGASGMRLYGENTRYDDAWFRVYMG